MGDEWNPDPVPSSELDVLFVLDVTGSMQPYIDRARDEINNIATDLKAYEGYGPGELRFGLIVFRDHPPQDRTMLAHTYGFTSDINSLRRDLTSLRATGGGDGPEAQEDALELALFAGWRSGAAKAVELITDSPPHGVSPGSGDGFPSGCPLLIDILRTADRMADKGISLHVLACEPSLDNYRGAHDFYVGLSDRTKGSFAPLADPGPMRMLVTGFASKAIDSDRFTTQYRRSIQHHAHVKKRTAHDIAVDLHAHLSAEGAHHFDVTHSGIYKHHEEGNRDAHIWATARSLRDAKQRVSQPAGKRLTPAHRGGGHYPLKCGKIPITRGHVI
ncbi:uncharacterized protein PHACADRAFT_262470 [Phanerochaete carnosa HHB-10118-sp]|uniref:VWFA domain-containing protein n=1 Tax=Phanerochaete carnosa (strain HHB-10118-sp) TaxID=650164 RepID=K5UQB9_PHACS|nr:uncharacterized protein PHACADRAFT_262470 [Phanerochaete carnosa HHB-10118-sp]EKM52021.1 hypothetical protein PHACADRAFT_262470 [Phanerochaete carnosa HHB-10118-sp]